MTINGEGSLNFNERPSIVVEGQISMFDYLSINEKKLNVHTRIDYCLREML